MDSRCAFLDDCADPTSQEVISHGDTLLTADANPRMRVSYEEETATSVLIVRNPLKLLIFKQTQII